MRLESRTLGFVINFLLGAAWAVTLIGALTSFLSFYHNSLVFAFLSVLIGALPGLIGVLALEYFITDKEKLAEMKRQTQLLEAIKSRLDTQD